MADDNGQDGQQVQDGDTANGADNQPQVGIITQYVKDLSFENPNAPGSFQLQEQPRIDVAVNVGASRPAEDAYEVALKIDVKATAGDTVAFNVELVYAGLFGLRNVPEEAIEPFLLIEAPRLLFPFARNAVANAIRDGGFPQLLLEPIDFAALYTAQRGEPGDGNPPIGSVAGHA